MYVSRRTSINTVSMSEIGSAGLVNSSKLSTYLTAN